MTLSVRFVLMLIAAVLLMVSAFVDTERVDLFKLGWGMLALGYVVGGG